MNRELPSLNAVRMFEAAARHRNFTRAAEQLFVTQGAVSRQIKQLEEELNQVLFRRDGPKLELTEVGQLFYQAVQEGLGAIRRGVLEVQRQNHAPALTISVLPSFAATWLVPRIVRFQDQHPEFELRLAASYESVDFTQHPDIDAAIRFGTGGWSGVYSECLINEQMFPVCSPDFRAASGDLSDPSQLFAHPLIYADSGYDQWPDWFAAANQSYPDNARGPRYSDELMLQRAAIEGHGIALVRSLLVSDELRAGRLVRLFDVSIHSRNSYYFVCSAGRQTEARVLTLLQWLRDEALDTDAACNNLRANPEPGASRC